MRSLAASCDTKWWPAQPSLQTCCIHTQVQPVAMSEACCTAAELYTKPWGLFILAEHTDHWHRQPSSQKQANYCLVLWHPSAHAFLQKRSNKSCHHSYVLESQQARASKQLQPYASKAFTYNIGCTACANPTMQEPAINAIVAAVGSIAAGSVVKTIYKRL